jgi:hypothetical protein
MTLNEWLKDVLAYDKVDEAEGLHVIGECGDCKYWRETPLEDDTGFSIGAEPGSKEFGSCIKWRENTQAGFGCILWSKREPDFLDI